MNKDKYQKVSIVLILIAILMFGASMYIIINKEDSKKDYAPSDAEPGAVKLDEEESTMSSSGSKVSIKYKNEAIVDLGKGKVELFFQNPSRSNQNVILEIRASELDNPDEEITIAKSNIVPVGYGIYELSLYHDLNLKKGDYSGRIVVNYYDVKTGEKSAVNTNIPIAIEVM